MAVPGGAPDVAAVVASGEIALSFGEHLLLPHRRQLFVGAKPVELGSRAFDTLLVLIEAEGRVVTKDELLRRVWPDTVVDKTNVTVQIAAVRRALGNGWDLVKTDAGRGYRFAGTVRQVGGGSAAASKPVEAKPVHGSASTNLPMPISSLVGRERDLKELLALVTARRLVTLTGTGGIGKTQLALRAARLALRSFADGAWVVELGALRDPDLVPNAVARVIGVEFRAGQSLADQIVAALARKRLLLVIDNCEHVIAAAARISETLLRGAPQLHVLATSREPLAAEGEHVYPVNPLTFPAADVSDVALGLEHSAVQLFLERARAANPLFVLDEHTMPRVSKICRRLDGIPLAIELAAACVASLGVDTLARRLNERFRLLTGGRRTALPRQQTLSAALDWSYDLLTPSEQAVFRRIAVFAGSFALDSAGLMAADADLDAAQAADIVIQLVRKSLVTFDIRGSTARYRLLDTTRSYASAKLTERGEAAVAARRHAEHFRDLLERAEAGWETTPVSELTAKYAPEVDNIRAALSWAFGGTGDASIGIALAAASVSLWTLLSILGECRDLVDEALSRLAKGPSPGTRHEMLLQTALARSSMWAKGAVTEVRSAASRALELAEQLGDREYQLRAIYCLWIYRLRLGANRTALALAERFRRMAAAKADAAAIRTGIRLEGVSFFYLGEYAKARAALERIVGDDDAAVDRSFVVRFGLDQRVSALCCLARILWVQGFPDESARLARASLDEARLLNHGNSTCIALCLGACAVATMAGDVEAVEQFAPLLIACAERHGLGMWQVDGMAFKGWAAVRRGETAGGLALLKTALDEFRQGRIGLHHPIFAGALAEALGAVGRAVEGLAMIGEALTEASHDEALWCVPELLRIRGEITLRRASAVAPFAAERDFRESIDLAARQGARSWQLRAALSLARVRQTQGRAGEAREILEPVYASFTEGFDTADLISAKTLLAALR